MTSIALGAVALTAALLAGDSANGDLERKAATEEVLASLDPQKTVWLHAPHVALGDGRVLEDAWVVVEDGVVKAVGSDLQPQGSAATFELDGWLTPGLIALSGHEGTDGDRIDPTRPVMPDADVSFAFRPDHPSLARTLAAGVTSVVLTPDTSRLVPGTTAVVKTAGGGVVRAPAQLVLVFSDDALSNDAYPTSYGSALAELERRFAEPQGAFSKAAAGTLPVLMQVDERHEIANALDFAQRFGLRGALYGSLWAGELTERIAASGLGVVLQPEEVGMDSRALRTAVRLGEAGVRLGFGLEAPAHHPQILRFAAAAAVRAGLDREKALAALTGDAASIADVAGRIGRIEPGRDADLVLWSGHPLDLRSSVKTVWIDGERVHGGDR